jgi:hypothetical protein
MKIFSYVVARDFGFAPNPFGGICTLATCKPEVRQRAMVGDLIVGIASLAYQRTPSLIYVMRVGEVITYDAYWNDARFKFKKPSRTGSVKQLFGDNIYCHGNNGEWVQLDSHHSYLDGSPNKRNIKNDTKSSGVLIADRFAYWGSNAYPIPGEFLDFDGECLTLTRGYKNKFSVKFVAAFEEWFEKLGLQGFYGDPCEWQKPRATWAHPLKV